MGQRVTIRSRPRYDAPFYAVVSTAAAQTAASSHGPFTVHQFAELLWRVKAITVTASLGWSDNGDPEETGTIEISRVMLRSSDPFAFYAIDDESGLLPNIPYASGGIWEEDDSDSNWQISSLSDLVFVDETGKYWIDSSFGFSVTQDGGYVLGRLVDPPLDNQQNIDVSLAFADGSTVPLKLSAEVPSTLITSATATVVITEWYPYADKSGAAAWSSSTGLPINDGPAG